MQKEKPVIRMVSKKDADDISIETSQGQIFEYPANQVELAGFETAAVPQSKSKEIIDTQKPSRLSIGGRPSISHSQGNMLNRSSMSVEAEFVSNHHVNEQSKQQKETIQEKKKQEASLDMEESQEVIAQLIREGEPMRLTNWFVDRPGTVILIQVILLLVIALICYLLGYFQLTKQHTRDYLVWGKQMTRAYDMNSGVVDLIAAEQGKKQQPIRNQEAQRWDIIILYKSPTDKENLLDKEYLLKINQIENTLKSNPDWKTMCRAQSSTNQSCHDTESFISPLKYLDGINKDLEFDLGTFATGHNRYEGNWTSLSQSQLDKIWQGFFDSPLFSEFSFLYNSFKNDAGRTSIEFMRCAIVFGAPLHVNGVRYNDLTDEYQNQTNLVVEFQKYLSKYLINQEHEDQNAGRRPLIAINFSEEYALQVFNDVVQQDTSFALFSVAFVMFYFVVHLKSFFLAFIGAFMIATSFGITALLFQGVFRIHYYQTLHSLIIFLVLGISADDIFVFIEAWRQSACIELFQGNPHKRMSYTWKRAVRAMAVTSSTTAVAFLANYFSPLMPFKSLGIYAAIIILANYLLVSMLFPSAIVFYEMHFDKYSFCCCFCGKLKDKSKQTLKKPKSNTDIRQKQSSINDPESGNAEKPTKITIANIQDDKKDFQVNQMGTIEKFFGGSWNNWVFKLRYIIIIASILWCTCAVYYAQQIGPITKMEDFYPPDHRQTIFTKAMRDHFYGSNVNLNERNAIKVQVYWGVEGIDQQELGYWNWNASEFGKIKLDEDFCLSPQEAQQNILDFCEDLKVQEFVVNKQVKCWLKDSFDAWLREPTDQTKTKLQMNPQYQVTPQDLNGKGLTVPLKENKFDELLLKFSNSVEGKKLQSDSTIGFLDDKLVFFQIFAVTTVQPYDTAEIKKPVYDQWEKYLEGYRENTLKCLKSVKQTANIFWAWMDTEQAFVKSAISGIGLAMMFAFLILLIATKNIIMAILAILCVSMVVVSVLAIMVLCGWELGISESISVVILIGLAVDYVVHLAQDYIHSAQESRHSKIKQAFTEMGVTILSGTITTLGCGSALFGGQMITFQKFAVIITSTIMFSFASAMLLFGALCHIIGPEKGFGNIDCCFKKKKRQ